MLRLRSSVDPERASHLSAVLRELDGVRRIVQQPDYDCDDATVIVADVEAHAADELVEAIAALAIHPDDYVLTKVDVVAPLRRHRAGEIEGFAWIEVIGQARLNSRPLARYLALITAAAVITGLGVISSSSILVVGGMAVSPDLLPICATCVGLVAGRAKLARRSFVTLSLGLGLVVVVVTVMSAGLKLAGLLPDGFEVEDSSLQTLATTDYSTVLVALAAGVAAMLSFETRAAAVVGVAISVTTMPASAYLGVAIGSGSADEGLGALVVLTINVALMLVSGSLTLMLQRWLPNRSGAPV